MTYVAVVRDILNTVINARVSGAANPCLHNVGEKQSLSPGSVASELRWTSLAARWAWPMDNSLVMGMAGGATQLSGSAVGKEPVFHLGALYEPGRCR